MSGSSGGGSSSGAVSYPAYMQTQHEDWLTAVAAHMVVAQTGDNPYTSAVAYDPDCALAATNYIISLFYDQVIAEDPDTDWDTYYDAAAAKYTAETITAISAFSFSDIFSSANLAAAVTAYQTDLESRRNTDFLPAFQIGMSDIGAVNSSAYTIGSAIITARVAADVAKFSADLYFQGEQKKLEYEKVQADENTSHNRNIIARDALITDQAIKNRNFNHTVADSLLTKDFQLLDFYRLLGHLTSEANRIKIVAKSEEYERNIKFDEQDALWDLETYQFGSNVMAGISGGSVNTKGNEISTGQSVLGGAMSGAAIGAQIPGAGVPGAVAGAVIGGIGGLLAS